MRKGEEKDGKKKKRKANKKQKKKINKLSRLCVCIYANVLEKKPQQKHKQQLAKLTGEQMQNKK